MEKRYRTFNTFLRKKFGERVHRVSIDAGFTCPNRDGLAGTGGCVYCAEEGARASYVRQDLSVREQLEKGIKHISAKTGARKFIAYFQAYSNTYAPAERLQKVYYEALSHPDVVGISIGTRPDCVDAGKLSMLEGLADNKYVLIEYGAQSMKEETLVAINRGHTAGETLRAINLTKAYKGIDVLAHLIFGLPGESRADMIRNVKILIEANVDAFKFHHLYIEKGTGLEEIYLSGKFWPLERDEYLDILAEVISILPPHIVIHRLFGDCSRDKLISPGWTLEKAKNIELLDQMLEKHSISQGSGFIGNSHQFVKSN